MAAFPPVHTWTSERHNYNHLGMPVCCFEVFLLLFFPAKRGLDTSLLHELNEEMFFIGLHITIQEIGPPVQIWEIRNMNESVLSCWYNIPERYFNSYIFGFRFNEPCLWYKFKQGAEIQFWLLCSLFAYKLKPYNVSLCCLLKKSKLKLRRWTKIILVDVWLTKVYLFMCPQSKRSWYTNTKPFSDV